MLASKIIHKVKFDDSTQKGNDKMAKSFLMPSTIAFAAPSLRQLRHYVYDLDALLGQLVDIDLLYCSPIALCRLVDALRTFGRLKA